MPTSLRRSRRPSLDSGAHPQTTDRPAARAGPRRTGAPAVAPLVSVIVPCYNASTLVGDALASILAQAWTEFEVIVVDDGSEDSEALERLLAPHGSRFRYLRQPNSGPSAARNLGIREARGELVAFLDSDDLWEPEFLAAQVEVLAADPGLSMTYCDTRLAGESARAGTRLSRLVPEPSRVTVENLLLRRCIIHPSTVVARRAALQDAGLFDEGIWHSEDLDLWVRLLGRGGRVRYVPRVLARRHGGGRRLTSDVERLITSQLEISRRMLAGGPGRDADLRPALERNVARCEARLRALAGVRHLFAGETTRAVQLLADANLTLRDWRLTAAVLGLRLFPRPARAFCLRYLLRQRLHPSAPGGPRS
jgi:hypothetical protein